MCQQKESNSFNLADYNVMFVLLEMQENSVSVYVYLIQQFKDMLAVFIQPFLHWPAGCFYTHKKKLAGFQPNLLGGWRENPLNFGAHA